MHRTKRILSDMDHRQPIAHAIFYVELDGSREVDIRQGEEPAREWAAWCERDGCGEVEIQPLYTDQEVTLAYTSARS